MDRSGSERNQIRVASHEADVTAVLHHRNDVAGEQRAFAPATAGRCRPMQHCAAFEMPAAVDQRNAVPEWQGCSFPEPDARAFAHDPTAVGSMQEDLCVKMV